MALIKLPPVSGRKRDVHMASSRSFRTVSRWFLRSLRPREDDEDSNERNGLLMSHLDQVVPAADADEEARALALHVEPKQTVVALKVSMHCHCCARKVEKQVSKLQGVTSFKVELESKKVTVVGNVSPSDVLESVCRVIKRAEILPAPY